MCSKQLGFVIESQIEGAHSLLARVEKMGLLFSEFSGGKEREIKSAAGRQNGGKSGRF